MDLEVVFTWTAKTAHFASIYLSADSGTVLGVTSADACGAYERCAVVGDRDSGVVSFTPPSPGTTYRIVVGHPGTTSNVPARLSIVQEDS
jgi:hypothetical protein